MSYIQIETTFKNQKDAEKITELLLSNKLVACGQYYSISSLYFWQGKQHNEKEVLLKLKTQAELYQKCEKLIKENHPYDVPQIIATEINGSEEYIGWINDETL
ncbi:MAG: divalent-cation tolerance protein CutA [Firmicutes bacterium]|nr:divalent-cation tolerance protein CutA [Bacillota bacterium]